MRRVYVADNILVVKFSIAHVPVGLAFASLRTTSSNWLLEPHVANNCLWLRVHYLVMRKTVSYGYIIRQAKVLRLDWGFASATLKPCISNMSVAARCMCMRSYQAAKLQINSCNRVLPPITSDTPEVRISPPVTGKTRAVKPVLQPDVSATVTRQLGIKDDVNEPTITD